MLSIFNRFIYVLIATFLLFGNIYAGQCQATTKKGTQCKRNAAAGSSYCWQHAGQETKTPTTTITPNKEKSTTPEVKPTEPKKEQSVSTQCQATTKKGTQCKRKAKAGSSYCWQHGG